MKRDCTLILGGDTILVQFVPKEVIATEEDNCDGEMSSSLNRMRIRDDCSPQAELRIIGHEIGHFHLFWGGLDGGIKAAAKDEDQGKALVEGVCDLIGSVLVEVVRDNPGLVQQIWEAYAKQEVYGDPSDPRHASERGCCHLPPCSPWQICRPSKT